MGSHAFHWYFLGLVAFGAVALAIDRVRRPKTEVERRSRIEAARARHLSAEDED